MKAQRNLFAFILSMLLFRVQIRANPVHARMKRLVPSIPTQVPITSATAVWPGLDNTVRNVSKDSNRILILLYYILGLNDRDICKHNNSVLFFFQATPLCSTNWCLNGGTCYVIAESDERCLCPAGYVGKSCEYEREYVINYLVASLLVITFFRFWLKESSLSNVHVSRSKTTPNNSTSFGTVWTFLKVCSNLVFTQIGKKRHVLTQIRKAFASDISGHYRGSSVGWETFTVLQKS